MTSLEQLLQGAAVRGLSPAGVVRVVSVEWFGDQAVKVTFEDTAGRVAQQLVYRADETRLQIVSRLRKNLICYENIGINLKLQLIIVKY